jgi:hypothetical protein
MNGGYANDSGVALTLWRLWISSMASKVHDSFVEFDTTFPFLLVVHLPALFVVVIVFCIQPAPVWLVAAPMPLLRVKKPTETMVSNIRE